MADQGEPIVLDDSDDEVQCLDESPLSKTHTAFHGTPPPTSRTFPHTRNTSRSSNNAARGGHIRTTSHSSNHNRNTSNTNAGRTASPDGSVKSSTSSSSNSSKKRKTKQVNDGRELNESDWSFQDGIRTPDNRSRESTMSLAGAPSPRSTSSVGSGSHSGDLHTPNTPTRQPATPARSYILIDSSSGPSNGTGNTTITPASTGNTPSKAPNMGATHTGAPIPFSFTKATASGSFSLPLRAGSNVSNSSNASSALSDPPAESRGVSFATFQNNLRFGSNGDGPNASSSSCSSSSSSGLNSPPQSRNGSFAGSSPRIGSPVSPPRLGRLTLEDSEIRRQVVNGNANGDLIDLCNDSDDDEDDEIQITRITDNGWGRDDTPLGIPYAFRRQSEIAAAQGSQRVSKSPTPPKRKRSKAFSNAEDEVSDESRYTPPSSSRGSSRAGSVPRASPGQQHLTIDGAGGRDSGHHSPPGSSRDVSRSPSAPRVVPSQEPVTIILDDEEEVVVVDLADNAEVDEDEEYTGDEDEDDLPEISALARMASPIDIEEGSSDSDELEYMGSRDLVPAPIPSVVAAPRRRSTIIPRRNPDIVYPLEDICSIIHKGWELKKGTFLEVLDPNAETTTTYLLINHVIHNHVTCTITLRGHSYERARHVSGMLKRTLNEMCRMLHVDEDDDRDALVQGQIEVGLDACKWKPRRINITNRPYGDISKRGTCTFRTTKCNPELKRAIDNLRQSPDFPGFWDDKFQNRKEELIAEKGLMAARWECILYWPTAKDRLYNSWARGFKTQLALLKGNDPHLMGPNVRQDDSLIRDHWRGTGATVLGGSYIPGGDLSPEGYFRLENGKIHKVRVKFDSILKNEQFSPIENIRSMDLTCDGEFDIPYGAMAALRGSFARTSLTIDLTDPTAIPRYSSMRSSTSSTLTSSRPSIAQNSIHRFKPFKRRPGQKYTYGDAFCGAGGATRGAFMANLRVLWGFDMDTHACRSWHRNFPKAAVYEMDAYSACNLPGMDFRCDILHMSPPCQYFSPAHTVAGKDDEINTAALFAIGPLLMKVKPRIATLEETAGLMNAQHVDYFRAVMNMFSILGYSVKYKVCQLANWGLPQRRERLIILAAAPGERLPEFPAFTHSRDPSNRLRPWAAAGPLIDAIPRDAPDHDLANVLVFDKPKEPWDESSICPKAMTCSGGQNYHYSGKRNLTNREFVAVQGFPMEHLFASKNVKKQIGNAVPPMIAKLLLEACRKSLEETDGVEKEVISLDDD